MTSEEMTTGSVSATPRERKMFAERSRWWNSTGGGSHAKNPAQKGNVKAGDGGAKFRSEWPEVDKENWSWMTEKNINTVTGEHIRTSCGPALGAAGRGGQTQSVVDTVVQQRDAGTGWLSRNRLLVAGGVIFIYVLIARLLGEAEDA